ncbi:putative G-protein coupled receptor CG31760 isoform X1 [Vespula squamosa]|uniref:G-protein coupled receptor CG31760 isoform X1 n=1 Tax=Vespula squamosa TaxID=30214 RepID=A0ABD2AGD2_VESSQ
MQGKAKKRTKTKIKDIDKDPLHLPARRTGHQIFAGFPSYSVIDVRHHFSRVRTKGESTLASLSLTIQRRNVLSGDSRSSRTRRSMGQPGTSSRRHREFLAERDRLGARRNDRSLSGERGTEGPDLSSISRRMSLSEEIQKLAAQIEFMKIVHMEMHNRHIKPKVGGYFSAHGHAHGHPSTAQSPIAKSSTASFILKSAVERGASAAAAAAVEDSTFPSGSLHRARRMEMLRERKAGKEREKEQKEKKKDREKEKATSQRQEPEQRELPHTSCEKV